MDESKNVTVSFPIFGLLGVLFVGLKLTGHIDWNWLWVTAPFWGPIALGIGIFLLIGIFAVIARFFSNNL